MAVYPEEQVRQLDGLLQVSQPDGQVRQTPSKFRYKPSRQDVHV